MTGRMNSEYGAILIDPEVVATYAGSVAVECFGIVGMAAIGMKDGLVKLLLRRESLKHGINVRIEDNKISLTFHCIISYGVNALTIADNLIDSVKYKVEEFTGMPVDRIDVLIEGVRVID